MKNKCDEWKEDRSKTLPNGSPLDTKDGPCAICLEETITNPVTLPCGHEFCFDCVGQYPLSSESDEASCPYCRGEIPDVLDKATEREGHCTWIEHRRHLRGQRNKRNMRKLALAEMDSLDELANTATEDAAPEDSQGLYLLMLHGRASI